MQDLLTKFENLTIQSDFIFKKGYVTQTHLQASAGGAAADRNCGYQLSGGRKDA